MPDPIIRCPACGTPGTEAGTAEMDLPYFGRVLEMLVRCTSCGYRAIRFHFIDEKEPARFTFRAESLEDLWARVIRSNTGWVRIPELGFAMEPREAAEAFVTNVEGLLVRARDAIAMAARLVDTPEAHETAEMLLERIDRFLEAQEPFTIVIEDPFGTSGILHPRVERARLTQEEVDALLGETGLGMV